MSYFKSNPGARRAYRARWAAAWQKMLATGAVSPDEEDAERKRVLQEAAKVSSSEKLTRPGYEAVMLHLGTILGEEKGDKVFRNPWRATRIAKIEHIAKELRPEDPESYIIGVLDDMGVMRDPAKWRTGLIDDYLHNTMLTMIAQQRRERARAAEAGGQRSEVGGRRSVTPAAPTARKEKGARA